MHGLLKRADLRILHAKFRAENVKRCWSEWDAAAHSAFRLAEFRSDDRQAMLVIEEAC